MTNLSKLFAAAILLSAGPLILNAQKPSGHPYYPLALGNTWRYFVRQSGRGGRESKVVWRVTKMDTAKSGRVIYQVWPTPMQADDEAMQLTISDSGLEEVSTRMLVLRLALSSGDQWSARNGSQKGQANQAFKVISVGQPCWADSTYFLDCAVVEELDPSAKMRTVTTYAKGVGPVEYRYFRMKPSSKEETLQTVTLRSYTIRP